MLLLKRNYTVITAVLNNCRVFFPQSNPLLLLMVSSLGISILISYCWNSTVSLSLSSVSHTQPSQRIWSKENQNWGRSHPPDLRNKQTNQCANKVVILQNIYTVLTLPILLIHFSQQIEVFKSRAWYSLVVQRAIHTFLSPHAICMKMCIKPFCGIILAFDNHVSMLLVKYESRRTYWNQILNLLCYTLYFG